jgi:polyisoprenoid-binding protein YceI
MKMRLALAAVTALFAFPAAAAEEVYLLDPAHSHPQWEARHIGFSNQHGSFQKHTGKVVIDRAAKTGSVEFNIETASIRTFDDRLDAIVKGERFFNVEKFPTIAFKSTKVDFDGDRIVGVEGDLTMMGVTKPVSFKVADFKCGEFNKKMMCGAEATSTIKRSEFGMTNNLANGSPADEIRITVPVEGYLQPPA